MELTIGRPEQRFLLDTYRDYLRREKVLVTGALGSIGRPLCEWMKANGIDHIPTDIGIVNDSLDVRDMENLQHWIAITRPTLVAHLAGAKHAPHGEKDPRAVARVNIDGTHNVLFAAASCGARVVTASTCKACDPETAYGATKLIAERMTLNLKGSVTRYYNVVDTDNNVFRLWEEKNEGEPIPVTNCTRFLMTSAEAVGLTVIALATVRSDPGRYTIDPGPAQDMMRVAKRLYPDRDIQRIPPRRGDRMREPQWAKREYARDAGQLLQVLGPHDPQ
jgi:UDP-N-acetylglucosamine 4,6-dehydratase/5-epimerase